MSAVRAWLEHERNSRREVPLDAALLAGRGVRYAASRTALVAVRAGTRTVLHTVELWLLNREIPFEFLIPLFAMRALPGLVTGLQWGALETLRRSIRSDVHAHNTERARADCEAWLTASALLAVLVLACTVLFVSRAELPEDGPNGLYGAFAIVSAFAFGLEVWSRTYHASAFALGRVYRPLWSIVLPDALELACIAALWPRLGPFSLHAGVLLTALVRFVLARIYTRRALVTRRLPVPRAFRMRALKRLTLTTARDAATHACMAAPFQLDRAFLLVLLMAPAPEQGQLALAAPYYAFRPLVGLAQAWARPFFSDFVRIDVPGYGVLRVLLTRALARVGYITAALSSLIVALACTWSFGMNGLWVGLWLVPLSLVRARFSLDQIRAFAYGAHRRQLAITAFLAVGITIAHAFGLNDRMLVLVLVCLLLCAQRAQRHVDSAAGAKRMQVPGRLPVSAWLRSLSAMREGVGVRVAQVDLDSARSQAVLQTLASARPALRCTRVGRAWLLWWEPLATEMTRPELARIVGGTICRLAHLQAKDGPSALRKALQKELFPGPLHQALTQPQLGLAALSTRVRQTSEAITIDVEGRELGRLAKRSGRELSLLRRALIAATREQHHVPAWAPWQAAAYAPGGETQVAYVWPAHVPGMAEFRRQVLHTTWHDSAFAPVAADHSPTYAMRQMVPP
jgi:hypothetical protein